MSDALIDRITNAVDKFIRDGGGTYDELQTVVATAMKDPPREHVWEFYANGSFCKLCGTQLGSGQPCR